MCGVTSRGALSDPIQSPGGAKPQPLFGHVLTGESDADSVWGPVQVCDAVSVHPVDIENMAITRVLRSREEEGTGMGRRGVVRYGLYKAKGSYSPGKASKYVTKEDLRLLY